MFDRATQLRHGTTNSTAKVCDATDFQYQAYVATTVEVAKGKCHHKVCGTDQRTRQQAHVVIKI